MVKDSITLHETVDFLNELLVIDPDAVNAMFSFRFSCGRKLADHPTVQVGMLGGGHPVVGLIGILNGLFGADEWGWGHLSADYNDQGRIIRFRVLTEVEIAGYQVNTDDT
jgi:hypothetical protein